MDADLITRLSDIITKMKNMDKISAELQKREMALHDSIKKNKEDEIKKREAEVAAKEKEMGIARKEAEGAAEEAKTLTAKIKKSQKFMTDEDTDDTASADDENDDNEEVVNLDGDDEEETTPISTGINKPAAIGITKVTVSKSPEIDAMDADIDEEGMSDDDDDAILNRLDSKIKKRTVDDSLQNFIAKSDEHSAHEDKVNSEDEDENPEDTESNDIVDRIDNKTSGAEASPFDSEDGPVADEVEEEGSDDEEIPDNVNMNDVEGQENDLDTLSAKDKAREYNDEDPVPSKHNKLFLRNDEDPKTPETDDEEDKEDVENSQGDNEEQPDILNRLDKTIPPDVDEASNDPQDDEDNQDGNQEDDIQDPEDTSGETPDDGSEPLDTEKEPGTETPAEMDPSEGEPGDTEDDADITDKLAKYTGDDQTQGQEDPAAQGDVDPNADPEAQGEVDPNADPNADPTAQGAMDPNADPNTAPGDDEEKPAIEDTYDDKQIINPSPTSGAADLPQDGSSAFGADNYKEDLPIEVEKIVQSAKYELDANNAYDFYELLINNLIDDESITAVNSVYGRIPEKRRRLTPAKYLYDKAMKEIVKKRTASKNAENLQGGGMQQGMPQDPSMMGGQPPMDPSMMGGAGGAQPTQQPM